MFAIFSDNTTNNCDPPSNDRKLHELYSRAKALFDLVAPQEYGIDLEEKWVPTPVLTVLCVLIQRYREEIGVLTSLPLLRKIVGDLEAARNNGGSSLTLYFTKESHIHTLVNLLLLSGLPIANRRIPELDYAVGLSFFVMRCT